MRILLTPRARVASSVIRLLDPAGTPRLLRNDSACGISVTSQPDGSVAVETAFDGCYTQVQPRIPDSPSRQPWPLAIGPADQGRLKWHLGRWDRNYRTTVQIEGVRPDGRKTTYKEELRCPEPRLGSRGGGLFRGDCGVGAPVVPHLQGHVLLQCISHQLK
ncbi:zona pellucida sperm-binding protein 4-like [Crotalus tigris]|uniref:zona pellucida sperm-binding protein 4-like n=1 Tax=Crotalus tigris TaxID=88082 RepID=UPI00192F5B80|nr:zona pellucida sperm-binding protein 4-like [Crotalus tigris]